MVLSLALLLVGTAGLQGPASAEFIVGAVYIGSSGVSSTSVASDMETLRRAGFTAVRLGNADMAPAAAAAGLIVLGDAPATGEARIPVSAVSVAEARAAFWMAVADGVRRIVFAPTQPGVPGYLRTLAETAGVVTRNPKLFAPMRVREGGIRSIDAIAPSVEVTMLESPEALIILAFNRSSEMRKATIRFEPEIPEAIWQDLESGAMVNFVMEKAGPVLEQTFAPNDVRVLMIRKTLRE